MIDLIAYTWILGVMFTWGVTISAAAHPFKQSPTVLEMIAMLLCALVGWPFLLGVRYGSD